MDGSRKAYNWGSNKFTNEEASTDKKSRSPMSVEGDTIPCLPRNCISRSYCLEVNLKQQLLTSSFELQKIQKGNPAWFSVMRHYTDVCNAEQLVLSVRLVNSKYEVFKDPVGLFIV